MEKIVVVIPALNEERFIGNVIDNVKKFTEHIIVVDDGSIDNSAKYAKERGAHVINHLKPKGLGCALRAGIVYALANNADIVVTLDADNQHDPDDIPEMITPLLKNQTDIVIGSRFLRKGLGIIPLHRKISNRLATIVTRIVTRYNITDSQSGYRAFSSNALRKMHLKGKHMEIATEFILEGWKNKLRITEIPIKSIYENETSSFDNIRDTFRITKLLLCSLIKTQ